MYAAFKCGYDSEQKLEGISQSYSENINFDEYKNCSDGQDYRKCCDNYVIRSINLEMYLQRVTKSALYQFDGKRC